MVYLGRCVVAGVVSGALSFAPAALAAEPSAPAPATSDESTSEGASHDVQRARRIAIAGGAIGGTGLFLGTLGFGVLGGIHAASPGPGRVIVSDDPAHARRTVRLANNMATVGYIGGSLFVSGAIIATIGLVKLRRARRFENRRVAWTVAPGPASLGIVGRF